MEQHVPDVILYVMHVMAQQQIVHNVHKDII